MRQGNEQKADGRRRTTAYKGLNRGTRFQTLFTFNFQLLTLLTLLTLSALQLSTLSTLQP